MALQKKGSPATEVTQDSPTTTRMTATPTTTSASVVMDMPEHTFSTAEDLKKYITTQARLHQGGKSPAQYHAVHSVPPSVFDNIDKNGLAGARLKYDYNTNDLIIKLMPSLRHDATHLILIKAIETRVLQMGVDEYRLFPTGSTTYKGNSSGKQGDSGVKPVPERKGESAWPTLVVECGVGENINQLRIDSTGG